MGERERLAILEEKQRTLRRDFDRFERDLEKAEQNSGPIRVSTGPQPTVHPHGRRDAALAGSGAAGGALLYAIAEWLLRNLTQ